MTTPRTGVFLATLDRPTRRNAIIFRMFDGLRFLCERMRADGAIRVLILTGEGAGFGAGLDLADAKTLPEMSALEMLRGQESWGWDSPRRACSLRPHCSPTSTPHRWPRPWSWNQVLATRTADMGEALSAFLETRPPVCAAT